MKKEGERECMSVSEFLFSVPLNLCCYLLTNREGLNSYVY